MVWMVQSTTSNASKSQEAASWPGLSRGEKKKKQPEAKLQVQRSLHYNLGQRE